MKKIGNKLVVGVAMIGLLIDLAQAQGQPKPSPKPAAQIKTEPNPIGDFFKRLGDSIAQAGKRDKKPPTKAKKRRAKKTGKNSNAQEELTTEAPTPEPVEPVSPTPTPPSVRSASAAPAAKGKKRDVPYGIPVPDKPGLVTSPFAPDAGMVDVRKFPPGTEVNDPYTGKTFLVP